jgi:hypothetical protein
MRYCRCGQRRCEREDHPTPLPSGVVPERDRRHCWGTTPVHRLGFVGGWARSTPASFYRSIRLFFLTQRCQQSETQQDLCDDNGHDAIRVATAGRLGVDRRRRFRLAVFAAAPPPQSPHDDRSAAAAAASIPLRPSVLPIYWLVGRTVQAQGVHVVSRCRSGAPPVPGPLLLVADDN